MALRYYEDFLDRLQAGTPIELGTVEFTADAIVEFARAYDPQIIHTDPERARSSIYGGLIASGWHTAASYMRLLVDAVIGQSESLGSPGIENLKWLKPVRPGDTLHARLTLLDARPSQSRPTWGIVRSRGEMLNQHGETVMQIEAVNLIARRPD